MDYGKVLKWDSDVVVEQTLTPSLGNEKTKAGAWVEIPSHHPHPPGLTFTTAHDRQQVVAINPSSPPFYFLLDMQNVSYVLSLAIVSIALT